MTTLLRVAAALTSLLLAVGLTGCGDGPTAAEVQHEHQTEAATAVQEIESAMDPLTGAGEELGSATRDGCRTGQHNWKIDDPYDVICTVEVRKAYHVTGPDFREAADSVTEALPACPDGTSDAEATLREYWDELKGTETHNFEGPYRPDYLPSYRLDCAQGSGNEDGETAEVQLTVTSWATLPADRLTRDAVEDAMGRPCTNSTERDPCQWDGVAAGEVLASAAADEGWIVFVLGSKEYARTS